MLQLSFDKITKKSFWNVSIFCDIIGWWYVLVWEETVEYFGNAQLIHAVIKFRNRFWIVEVTKSSLTTEFILHWWEYFLHNLSKTSNIVVWTTVPSHFSMITFSYFGLGNFFFISLLLQFISFLWIKFTKYVFIHYASYENPSQSTYGQ